MLRALCDAIVVGAGTARDEGYGPAAKPLVLVSRRGEVPEKLRDARAGIGPAGHLRRRRPGLAEARELLGDDSVLVAR